MDAYDVLASPFAIFAGMLAAGWLIYVWSGRVAPPFRPTGGKAKAYTGGEVKYPPSIADGRAYVGSGDGWVYCFEAAGGKLLCAQAEQGIGAAQDGPVHDMLEKLLHRAPADWIRP